MKHCYLILITIILLSSCRENEREKISRLVNDWQGKEIVFPDDIIFTTYATDTVNYNIPDSEYKILIYVDSIGCTSCKLQLDKWKQLIAYTDSVTNEKIPYLFFFHAKDIKEIRYLLKRDRFSQPVCLDTENKLDRLNGFPAESNFQTFLLDRENKVKIIGNPVHNMAIKDLYLKEILPSPAEKRDEIITKAEVENTTVDLGNFSLGETKTALYEIRNTGDSPLVIIDSSITCGCGKVSYSKRPVQPGEMIKVEVLMTPTTAGSFDETVTLKCNTQQLIKLFLKGKVN